MGKAQFEDMDPEFREHTLACTTFRLRDGGRYTIVTVKFTNEMMHITRQIVNQWGVGNIVAVDGMGNYQEYGSILWLNGALAQWPLGNLPGNIIQGVFRRYTTRDLALAGHEPFVLMVKQVLAQIAGHMGKEE